MGDNLPDFLGDVRAIIADLRGLPLADLIGQTLKNAQELYGFYEPHVEINLNLICFLFIQKFLSFKV